MCTVALWANNGVATVSARNIDFSEGSPVQKLDLVNNREMIGESNSQLASAEAFAWAMPSQRV